MSFQNIIIRPKPKTQTAVTPPKISKNRLLSDFCLLLNFNDITLLLFAQRKVDRHCVLHTNWSAILNSGFPFRRFFKDTHCFFFQSLAWPTYGTNICQSSVFFNNERDEYFTLYVIFPVNTRIFDVFFR